MRMFSTLMLIFAVCVGYAQDRRHEPGTYKAWTYYNGVGVGFGENRVIATEHVNVGYKKFIFGIYARWSARKDWRDVQISPTYMYHEYKFVNEFSALLGWRLLHEDKKSLVLMAGPMFRNENARSWPDKGSGSAPFIGRMWNDIDGHDVKSNGGIITLEWIHTNIPARVGISILGFFSFTPKHVAAGVTVNFLFGRITPQRWPIMK